MLLASERKCSRIGHMHSLIYIYTTICIGIYAYILQCQVVQLPAESLCGSESINIKLSLGFPAFAELHAFAKLCSSHVMRVPTLLIVRKDG